VNAAPATESPAASNATARSRCTRPSESRSVSPATIDGGSGSNRIDSTPCSAVVISTHAPRRRRRRERAQAARRVPPRGHRKRSASSVARFT
jgi:hypothetical protein